MKKVNERKQVKLNKGNSELKGKTLLVVNTGSLKKKFILQKLNKLDLNIICLNKEKNWAQGYVDHWIITDTNNHSKAIEDLESFLSAHPKIKINGAVTFWEDDVLLVSKITDKLNLVGVPFKISKKARNKYLFRKFCEKNSIVAPKNMLVRSAKDLKFAMNNFSFPVVLKPTHGSSSAFVIKAEDADELATTYYYIRKNISSQIESSLSEGKEIMVEEYIDGDEVDIDILLQNGKIKFYSIVDNYKTEEPFFIETQQAIPSELPEKDQDDLIEMAEKALEKLGVQNGCIHFEAKATKNGPVPLEVNLRMGGDETYSFTKEAWRVDLIESAVKISMGVYVEKIRKTEIPYKYLISNTFTPESSGLLVKLDVDEKIKKAVWLEELSLFKKIGDPVLVPPEGYEYLGWMVASGDNAIDAEDNLDYALKRIKYEIAKFDPASSIGKTSRKNRFSMAAININALKGAAKLEKIRLTTNQEQKKLHIGVACNNFQNGIGAVEQELSDIGHNIERTLQDRGYKVTYFDFNNIPKVIDNIAKSNIDLVFNVCERINNSSFLEPHVASIFDIFQIPYTGSSPFTLGLCIDKIRVKKLLTYHGIPTPKWDYAYNLDEEVDDEIKYPLIVKPANTDNSIGITNNSVVINKKELKREMEKIIKGLNSPALIEEYIEGDEYDVSILGSEENDLLVLPLKRSIFNNMPKGYWHIYPYDSKWGKKSAYSKIIVEEPAKSGNKKLESLITEIALDTYNILDCHDYGRVEIRVDKNNNPYILELNPNPSININDGVPSAAKVLGLNYGDFLEKIISLAIKRYKNRPLYYHLQTNII
ncbi:MAG: ATP-grasp domain-containing protein [Patescibacteria group bacterium]